MKSSYTPTGKDDIEVSEEDLKNLPYVRWCTLEAIRLRSPGAITKKVIKPIRIQVSSGVLVGFGCWVGLVWFWFVFVVLFSSEDAL